MSATTITPTLLVAPGIAWRDALAAELPRLSSAELMRLRDDPDQARRSAGHMLHRLVNHLGWREAFLFDETEDQPPEDDAPPPPTRRRSRGKELTL